MKISELLNEQTGNSTQKVQRISSSEVVVKDQESGIETKIPKKNKQPGTIQRDEQGNLVLDPETPGGVTDDIQPGDKITTKPRTAQGTQGTIGTS